MKDVLVDVEVPVVTVVTVKEAIDVGRKERKEVHQENSLLPFAVGWVAAAAVPLQHRSTLGSTFHCACNGQVYVGRPAHVRKKL